MVRSIGFGVALLLLAACGGSSGGGMSTTDDSCVLLTDMPPLRMPGTSTAMELPALQVNIEVRFVTLSDSFYDSLGISFDQTFDPDLDPPPVGGSNGNGTSFATSTDRIGGLTSGALPLVPQGQAGIQILPIVHPSFVSPTPDMFISTNLPGDACIEFGAGTTFSLDGLNPVPGGQELPPIQGGTQVPIRGALFDSAGLNAILNAIRTDGTSELLEAPQVTVRDGQLATVQAATETPLITDMPAVWNGRFSAMNGAIGQVQTGPILAVRPVVSGDMTRITLKLIPEAQMATVFWPQSFNFDGTILSGVEVPVLRRRGVPTQITILDGQTVLLGGTLNANGSTVDRGVPIFGDLPLLGSFMRSHNQLDLNRNLMIFVTAQLIDPSNP